MKTAFRSLPYHSTLATGALAVLVILLATLAINGSLGATKTHAATALPIPSHVVVVVHSHWVNFPDMPSSDNMPFTSFPSNYNNLPKISFMIPNLLLYVDDVALTTS